MIVYRVVYRQNRSPNLDYMGGSNLIFSEFKDKIEAS